jgi:hypothetical protein
LISLSDISEAELRDDNIRYYSKNIRFQDMRNAILMESEVCDKSHGFYDQFVLRLMLQNVKKNGRELLFTDIPALEAWILAYGINSIDTTGNQVSVSGLDGLKQSDCQKSYFGLVQDL